MEVIRLERRPQIRIEADMSRKGVAELVHRLKPLEGPEPEMIVVVGGDGFMLACIRGNLEAGLPFYGMNRGTVGYLLNDALPDEAGLPAILHRYTLPLLEVITTTLRGAEERHWAFNDAWVAGQGGQVAWLSVEIDGAARIPAFRGDGLLVATPAGSTAYAKSMGASPLPLEADVLILVGSHVISPVGLRPVNLPGSSQVDITSTSEPIDKRPLMAYVDGRPLGPVQRIRVGRSANQVELLFNPRSDLAGKLVEHQFPGSS